MEVTAKRELAEHDGVISPKRKFNAWVNNPELEDYSLRYAPKSFRRWGVFAVAGSALGGIAYMADFAIGGSITLSYGFWNAFWAVLVVAAIIFLTGLPISYYSSKYNVDMDLLTRGAGFGYFGSTLTSLVYASFTFIYFALEGSVMAQALNLYFGIRLGISYLICSLIILPMVLYGMTFISKLQVWTQPIWLVLMILPFIAVFTEKPDSISAWIHFTGPDHSSGFTFLSFGFASGVVLSLIAQIGEQCDYLRFMPDKTKQNAKKWWLAVVLAGPGWVILGAIKQLGGSFLASYIAPIVGLGNSDQPVQMFTQSFRLIIPSAFGALTLAMIFVVLSQIKINVTNAYSGSLSWSNFFSRIFHFHPGRIVWLFLNVGIAFALMEFNVFSVLNTILGFYSNVAVAWVGAVASDLVINKTILKISPQYIEFKRAHLYNFNPVGFGSMMIASILSIMAYFGVFGRVLVAYSPFLSLLLAIVLAPILALATKGKYYIARENNWAVSNESMQPESVESIETITCSVCAFDYEREDMTFCPFHEGAICSLCCSLENSCNEMCKKERKSVVHIR